MAEKLKHILDTEFVRAEEQLGGPREKSYTTCNGVVYYFDRNNC